jgi:uncharacterized membrane protein
MDKKEVYFVVGAYASEDAAQEAYNSLRKQKTDWLKDAALVWKDGDKVKMKEAKDTSAGKGAVIGGLVGAAVGLLAGPVGWAALAGAALIGLGAGLHDGGIENQRLKNLGTGLKSGAGALILAVEDENKEAAEQALKDTGADVTTEGLDLYTIERLKEAYTKNQ